MNVEHLGNDTLFAVDVVEYDKSLTARQRENNAEFLLLRKLLGETVQLRHNDVGKPELDGYNISISHTLNRDGGYVAIILSKSHNVGIDIEYRSDRIMKIANRFLRCDEKPQTIEDNLICWCAKEAVYKLFSSEDLTYQEMRVNSRLTEVENLRRNISVPIYKVITDKYVLVWTEE